MDWMVISLLLAVTLLVTALIDRRCYNGITRILERVQCENIRLAAELDEHKRLERERVSRKFRRVMADDFRRLTGIEIETMTGKEELMRGVSKKEDAKLDEFIETVKRS